MAQKQGSFSENTCDNICRKKKRIIYFRTKDFFKIKLVSLEKINFEKEAASLVFPLANPAEGDITGSFLKYSSDLNGGLIDKFYKNKALVKVMKFAIPDELLEYLKMYPEMMERADNHQS